MRVQVDAERTLSSAAAMVPTLPSSHSLPPPRSRDRRANSDATGDEKELLIRDVDLAALDLSPHPSTKQRHAQLLHSTSQLCNSLYSSTLLTLRHIPRPLSLRTRLLWLATLLFILDHFLFPPHGLLPLRHLTSWPDHAAPTVCGWDYEASWKVGLARGNSPTTLSFMHHTSHLNPILTCADVPYPPVSFVADPFLLLVDDSHGPLPIPLHQSSSPSSSSSSSSPPFSPSFSLSPSSFPLSSLPNSSSSTPRAYLFYEMKNLVNMRGEIGVSVSTDASGLSGLHHLGTALSEDFHLSYPLPMWHAESGLYLLMPEVHQTLSVRIYSTSPALFPFGWTLHSTPLQGRHYVDTSPVYYRGLWYVFTTVGSSLLLYTAQDLLDASTWSQHPLSPLTSFQWRTSRSAGRPIIHDGRVIRFAQDDSSFYGMAVYAIELEELTPTTYREAVVSTTKPRLMLGQGQQWASQRLHHMDVHMLAGGEWIAVVDGDEHVPNHEFWQREGWFRVVKDVITLLLIAASAYCAVQEWRRHQQTLLPVRAADGTATSPPALRDAFASLTSRTSSASLALRQSWRVVPWGTMGRILRTAVLSLAFVLFIIAPLYPIRCGERCAYDLPVQPVKDLERQEATLSLPLPPDVSARFNLSSFPSSPDSTSTTALVDSLSAFTYPHSSASYPIPVLPTHPPLPSLSIPSSSLPFPLPFVPFPGFLVVTAVSSSYFDRLQNLLGSIHFWEPSQRVLVWDLGLTAEQAAAARCWQNVQLRPFPFHVYPRHVRNLYNYAWKPLMLEQAFALPNVTAILLLDSGVEIRAPFGFSDVKGVIMERGYWFARQTYDVEQRTMPETLQRLGIDAEAVRGRPFCAGGLHGFMKGSAAYEEVALRAFECAKDESCIAPYGSGRSSHNFDQSVMSALIYHTGRSCDPRRSYRTESMDQATADEADYNQDVVFLLRRWHRPKPYTRHIRGLRAPQCPAIHSSAREHILYPPVVTIDSIAVNGSTEDEQAQMETQLIQHKDGRHLQATDPLVQCLHLHNNSRYACRHELAEHQRAVVAVVAVECETLTAWVDLNITPHLRQLRCVKTWLLALSLFGLVWWAPLLRQLLSSRLSWAALLSIPVCFLLFPLSTSALDTYGTDSSLAVRWYTRLHSPPTDHANPASVSSASSSDTALSTLSSVRPAFPVVISLSVQAHQLVYLNRTLSSLAAQTLRPDLIVVNLPFIPRNASAPHPPLPHLSDTTWDGIVLRIHRREEDDSSPSSLSPLTRTLQTVTDPSALIIRVDAEHVYPSSLSSLLVQHAQVDNATAFGLCGWSFLFRPAPAGVTAIRVPWDMRGRYGREVDVLEGACAAAYRRGWFPAVDDGKEDQVAHPHPHCLGEEDVWLAGWLSTRAGVHSVVLPAGDDTVVHYGQAEGRDAQRVQQSAAAASGLHMMCIRGVEQTLGPWRQLRSS